MTFRHMHNDVRSEYLLLVVLENSDRYSQEYRHIRADVVRRAVPHVLSPIIEEGDVQRVTTWNDEYPSKCTGYRSASWVLSKTSGTYVDGMQLRGQIDSHPIHTPLNNGRPYGNSVNFKAHSIDWNTARAIADFYKKQDAFATKYNLTRRDDNFYVALNHLAQFLKITKVLFHKEGVTHCSLAEANCFEETDIAFASVRIDEMLKPFYKD
jgi:hypothetical protein